MFDAEQIIFEASSTAYQNEPQKRIRLLCAYIKYFKAKSPVRKAAERELRMLEELEQMQRELPLKFYSNPGGES